MRKIRKIISGILVIGLVLTTGLSTLASDVDGIEEGVTNLSGSADGERDTSCCSFKEASNVNLADNELDLDYLEIYVTESINYEIALYEAFAFVYIDQPVIYAPYEQNIAVVFADETMALTTATLGIRSKDTGDVYYIEAANIVDNGALFSINYDLGDSKDEKVLESIEYTFVGGDNSVTVYFANQNIEATYLVLPEVAPSLEDKFEINIYGTDKYGNEIAEVVTLSELEGAITDIVAYTDVCEISDTKYYEFEYISVQDIRACPNFTHANFRPLNASDRIIVVSAGHCATHTGANHNGLAEHVLNWEVAGIVVSELNRTNGITALRDRPTINCMWPTRDWRHCVTQRVREAHAVGATIFVDMHFNACTSTASHGAEVWIPNNTHNPLLYRESRDMATQVLRNIVSLGFANRGVRFHTTATGGEFISNRLSAELGMSSILVEPGFLSNTADANRIRDPNVRRNIAIQTARGIVAGMSVSVNPYDPFFMNVATGVASGATHIRAERNANSSSLRSLRRGEAFGITGRYGAWTRVQIGNIEGWMLTSFVRDTNRFGATTARTNLRSGPGTDRPFIRVIANGTNLQILGISQSRNWTRVRIGNQTGWILSRNIRTRNLIGHTRGAANLRDAPINGGVIDRIPRHTTLTMLGRSGDFTHVRVGGRYGWVTTSWLRNGRP